MEFRKMVTITLYAKQKKRHRCIETDFWTLWEKVRVGCFKRTASKHVYVWNIYAYVCIHTCICMKQIASPGGMHETSARMWYTGKTQRDRVEKEVEGGSGWGTHVNPWLIHFNVWQKPLQCCKVISLQLIKINEKKKKIQAAFKSSGTNEWRGL